MKTLYDKDGTAIGTVRLERPKFLVVRVPTLLAEGTILRVTGVSSVRKEIEFEVLLDGREITQRTEE